MALYTNKKQVNAYLFDGSANAIQTILNSLNCKIYKDVEGDNIIIIVNKDNTRYHRFVRKGEYIIYGNVNKIYSLSKEEFLSKFDQV